MKKLLTLLLISIIIISLLPTNINYAILSNSNELISLGTGNYKITLTKTTTIDDIVKVLGEPKLKTISAFGGFAYTFYTDSEYSNFLYVETTKEGKIISFGSIDKTYETNTYSYGDDYPYTENSLLHGYLFSNSGTIEGGIYYNKSALYSGNTTKIINYYKENYLSNQTKYLNALVQQAILMYNALSCKLGNKCEIVYDEELFYTNEQFKEFETSIRQYLIEMDKSNYSKAIGIKENIDIVNSSRAFLLNPMQFASMALNNKNVTFGNKNIAIFDYDYNNKIISAITIEKDTFKEKKEVELTEEEKNKLSEGRAEYKKAMENLNKESELYEIEPVVDTPEGLVAGKLKKSKLQGITDYVNAIRVAGGIPKLEVSEEETETAQHASTLMSYRFLKLGLKICHQPPKPDGVSEEYYKTAIGWGKGYAENLGYSLSVNTITASAMTYFMNLYLDDRVEVPVHFSHRQKVLYSKFTRFGFGISPNMSANEFRGEGDTNVFLEAWPSNGITFMETLLDKQFYWTSQFVDKYTIQETTTATVKCLNTGEIWNFTEEEKTNNRWFECYTDTISLLNNKVVIYDSSIIPEVGFVYEITLHDVKEDATNKIVDFTYRSAFEYADINNYPSQPTSIDIEIPENIKKVDEENIYYIPVGEDVDFNAIIDKTVTNKKITWSTSNKKVTVTQNGIVNAKELTGDVIIKVICDGTDIMKQIVVRPYNKSEQIKFDKEKIECDVLGNSTGPSDTLTITDIPEGGNIEWVVVSKLNPEIEYSIDDEYIQKYIKVEKNLLNDKSINIYAMDTETGNNEYTIIAKVVGTKGTYTGRCEIIINVPITSVKILPATLGLTISGHDLNINYEDIEADASGKKYFNIKASIYPKNTTDSQKVTWQVGDNSIVKLADDFGKFEILKEGKTTITVKTVNNMTDTINLKINVDLKGLTLNGKQKVQLGDTDILTLTRTPSIDNDKIIYESSDKTKATVDANGKVTFKNVGKVTIKAYSEIKPSVYATFTYNIERGNTYLELDKSYYQFNNLNESLQLNAKLNSGENTSVSWKTDNNQVATVDSNGKVTAKKGGITKISATSNLYGEVKCLIYVSVPVELSDGSKAYVGDINKDGIIDSLDVAETNLICNYNSATTDDIILADLNNNGDIDDDDASIILDMYRYGLKPGKYINIESISLNKNNSDLYVGSTITLIPTINPTNTTNSKALTWTSSNKNVATVDINGKVTAKAEGTAVITVQTSNGKKTSCNITVKQKKIEYTLGDVNNDGKVNTIDAIMILQHISKKITLNEKQMLAADTSKDGRISTMDAIRILQYISKKITEF